MEITELLKIKERIEKGKSKLSEAKGELKSYEDRLKNEYSCETVEEAQSKLKKLQKEIQDINDKINQKTEDLKEEYPTLFE